MYISAYILVGRFDAPPLGLRALTTRDAREQLSRLLRGFEDGTDETPVHFYGPHRRPVGAVVSAALATEMLAIMDDVAIAAEVLERTASDDVVNGSLEDFLTAAGVDDARVDRQQRG